MNDVLKIMRRNYYFTYVLLVLSAAAGFVLALHLHPGQQGEQTLSTIGIMLLLASAPYAFHYYKKQVEKLKRESAENQMRKIVNVVNVRLAIVCVPLMYNIIVYYLTASVSMLFAAAMSARCTAQYFLCCKQGYILAIDIKYTLDYIHLLVNFRVR